MKYLVINPNRITVAQSTLIVDYLNQGKVIVCPTDTIYGFACRADKASAIKKIKKIKGLALDKALLVLMNNLAQVKKYCYLEEASAQTIKKEQANPKSRPTSFILPHRHNLPSVLTGSSDGLGFRLPKSKFLRKILSELDAPLVSTSFNLSGQKVYVTPAEVATKFKIDLVVDAGVLKNKSSRLVDLRAKRAKILRK